MPRHIITIPAAIITLVVGVVWMAASIGSTPIEKLFGGSGNLDIVRQATEVRVYRLAHQEAGPPPGADLDAYETAGEPRKLDEKQRRELIALLTSESSYLWDLASACLPDFGAKIEVRRGDDTIVVAVCMQCEVLYVYAGGKWVGVEEFNPIAAQLKRFVGNVN